MNYIKYIETTTKQGNDMTTLNEMKTELSELQEKIIKYEVFYRFASDKNAPSFMNSLQSFEKEASRIEREIKIFCDNAVTLAKKSLRGHAVPINSVFIIEQALNEAINRPDSAYNPDCSYLCWLFDESLRILES